MLFCVSGVRNRDERLCTLPLGVGAKCCEMRVSLLISRVFDLSKRIGFSKRLRSRERRFGR